MKKLLRSSLVKYMVVGIASLAVDYGVLLLLFRVFEVLLVVASTASFLTGLLVSFLLNKYWSFQAERGFKKSAKQAVLYSVLVGFNLLTTNVLLVYFNKIEVAPEVSKLFATALITLWNFVIYKTIIFKANHQADPPPIV